KCSQEAYDSRISYPFDPCHPWLLVLWWRVGCAGYTVVPLSFAKGDMTMGWESITGPLESFLDFVVVILKLVVAVFGFLAGARVGTWLLPRNAKGSVRVLSMLICGGAGFLLLW